MVPSFFILKIRRKHGCRFSIWLPVFILWPVALILALLILPFILIADLVLRLSGIRIHILRMLGGVFSVISSLRGTRIKVNNPRENSIVNVTIL